MGKIAYLPTNLTVKLGLNSFGTCQKSRTMQVDLKRYSMDTWRNRIVKAITKKTNLNQYFHSETLQAKLYKAKTIT